ncbi:MULTISPECIES: amidohydrolase [unclassified Rhizobium]|uniref:amidohydrolase n=1 Tax=unclassified Rhizobium TaxID=2613769 RepID=UPI00160ACF53|nr:MULTISPECIES: amidohydrolase [unclassified Rhizobium]MBB3542150.1 amidohydrolase [Rhizobium sp. BK399]MCS3740270.1 amidohydrolase [Rhizobium sp. BK661]MCS4094274.1 amidohydrolase [Rhizobium sp. BK176]
MFLTDEEFSVIKAFRRELHRHPEISGKEAQTALRVEEALGLTGPDGIVTGIGGHGLAAVFEGTKPGPTVLIRAELDGLPIEEISDAAHRSAIPGRGHLCGHDGHMAILMAVAKGLGQMRPARGRAILMFQPAEENGAGAAAVLADPKFAALKPDLSLSLHNFPGVRLGHVLLKEGPVNCASRGMKIALKGKTSHASYPEQGIAPTFAMARLLGDLTSLGNNGPLGPDYSLVTVTHARLGEPAFGISPGEAQIWATLRTLTDEAMAALVSRAEELVRTEADTGHLQVEISYEDVFHQCYNSAEAVAELRRALDDEGVSHDATSSMLPMKASEDFGLFRTVAPAAMFFLGAGEAHPRLHNPDYDFPDELIATGSGVFMRAIRNILG